MRRTLSRLFSSLLSLFILVSLTFVLIHVTPGGPAFSILGLHATADNVAAVNKTLGLDTPLWRQYAIWWWHLAQGDLGFSYLLHRPVGALLIDYERNTIVMYSLAILLAAVMAIGLGLLHGVLYRRPAGTILSLLELALYAMPTFFLGALLVLVFASGLHLLPPGGLFDLREATPTLGSYAVHLILPVATIALVTMAGQARYFAQSVHEELGRDYVRTAVSKGAPFGRVLFFHVLRNALRPLVTLLGLSFPYVFAGGVVVETVFSYPGLGWLLWRSALLQDYPVLIAIVLLIGVLTIVGNLLADLVNNLLDPRASYA
jgi:peptide/nickel transport system permease protein